MKILSMTATFGKLDHETLSLRDGLNVVEAPNEWGKSTWCAFVVAMLYGISTSSRTKKDFLADKERYAPWSGKPMAGRMEILWQGKHITLERGQKGKIPFGEFRAYETETNIPIPGLTPDNCGQLLLGVEREVFTRAGFLRFSDLPVGEDEALRRRLNALVTTGDETGAGDDLAQKLRKLKNECRHNKTGLIPQAETQRDQLQNRLQQYTLLQEQISRLQAGEENLAKQVAELKNHQVALAYEKAAQSRTHAQRAQEQVELAQAEAQAADAACEEIPTLETADNELQRLQQVQQQWASLQEQQSRLPELPQKVSVPAPFGDLDAAAAMQQAQTHAAAFRQLSKPRSPWQLILALVAVGAAAGMLFINPWLSLPFLAASAVLLLLFFQGKKQQTKERQALADIYGNNDPDSWLALAADYQQKQSAYQVAMAAWQSMAAPLDAQTEGLKQAMELLTQGKTLGQTMTYWQQVRKLRQTQAEKHRYLTQAEESARTVSALVQTAPQPQWPDTCTLTEAQTDQALQQALLEQQQLHQRLGQCQGQMETLGDRGALTRQLEQVQERLTRLEEYNAALTLSMEVLTQATTELQRRFAPRISTRARELFGQLTGQRYQRLLLASDLSMEVAATDEDMPHGVLWRSDGTADQLYLALRLAVAEELTPDAPLVLDDAMVRFDDTRLEAAMEILKTYAKDKQVILFTCHKREAQLAD